MSPFDHIYLEASLMLDELIKQGVPKAQAMAQVNKRYTLTMGERELLWFAWGERQKHGKEIEP